MRLTSLALSSMAAVALLCLFVPEKPHQMQASGNDLTRVAGNVRNAILTGSAEMLFNSHAPWMQERGRMMHEEFQSMMAEAMKGSKEEVDALNAEVARDVVRYDPNGVAAIKTAQDVTALSPEKLHALLWGYYRLRGNNTLSARLNARWYQVDCEVWQESEPDPSGVSGTMKTRNLGKVEYRNAAYRDRITVQAVSDGSNWHVVYSEFRIAQLESEADMGLMSEDALSSDSVLSNATDAKRAEGEQLLGAGRDMARVYYAKHGEAPAKVEDCGMSLEDLKGKYFQLRNKICKKPDAERGGIVAEPVKGAGDLGFGFMTFDYARPNPKITWYETEEELNAAITAFETAK